MTAMLKPITGAWFEFRHHSAAEGKKYNEALHSFTADQWRAMLQDMHQIGMDTLVQTCSALVYPDEQVCWAPVDVFPQSDMACPHAMDVMMNTAEELGMQVFLSAGFYGLWTDSKGNMRSQEVEKRAKRACETLYAHYGQMKSFAGWYLPDETEAGPYFDPVFIDYTKRYHRFLKAIDPSKPLLIAPYGTNHIKNDDTLVRQLEEIPCDYVAYQDEVGVQKSTEEQTAEYYHSLMEAHEKAGRSRLWADIEAFDFEGKVYYSALLPTRMERLEKQIAAVSPYVDKVLCYAYPGMFSRPGSAASYGDPAPEKLYQDYEAFLQKIRG